MKKYNYLVFILVLSFINLNAQDFRLGIEIGTTQLVESNGQFEHSYCISSPTPTHEVNFEVIILDSNGNKVSGNISNLEIEHFVNNGNYPQFTSCSSYATNNFVNSPNNLSFIGNTGEIKFINTQNELPCNPYIGTPSIYQSRIGRNHFTFEISANINGNTQVNKIKYRVNLFTDKGLSYIDSDVVTCDETALVKHIKIYRENNASDNVLLYSNSPYLIRPNLVHVEKYISPGWVEVYLDDTITVGDTYRFWPKSQYNNLENACGPGELCNPKEVTISSISTGTLDYFTTTEGQILSQILTQIGQNSTNQYIYYCDLEDYHNNNTSLEIDIELNQNHPDFNGSTITNPVFEINSFDDSSGLIVSVNPSFLNYKLTFSLSDLFSSNTGNFDIRDSRNGINYGINFKLLSFKKDGLVTETCLENNYIPYRIHNKSINIERNYFLNEFTSGNDLDNDGITNENELTLNTINQLFTNFQKTHIKGVGSVDMSKYRFDMFDHNGQQLTNELGVINPAEFDLTLENWISAIVSNNDGTLNCRTYTFDMYSKCPDDEGFELYREDVTFTLNILDVAAPPQDVSINLNQIIYLCDAGTPTPNLTLEDVEIFLENSNNSVNFYSSPFGDPSNALPNTTPVEEGDTFWVSQVGSIDSGDLCGTYQNGVLETISSQRIEIQIVIDCCPTPQNLNVIGTTNTSATLEWNDSHNANWQIEYGPTGFTQGTGIITTANAIINGAIIQATINGLIPSNTYDFYVRANCGEDGLSDWIGPQSATTDCENCTSFKPEENKEYVISAWVREDHNDIVISNYNMDTDDIKNFLNILIIGYQDDGLINEAYQMSLPGFLGIKPFIQYTPVSNISIYNLNYSILSGYSFHFGPNGEGFQTFEAKCPIGSTSKEIVSVTQNPEDGTNTSYLLGIDCDNNQSTIERTYIYNFGNDCYIANTEDAYTDQVMTYKDAYLELTFLNNENVIVGVGTLEFKASGTIIDQWQRIQNTFRVPIGTVKLKIDLVNNFPNPAYFDDIRIFPVDGNMKSFVYDQQSQRLMAELDENNFATFYEYDKEGGLIRVKKETEKGVFTIQETRSGNVKKE